jgi:hypothetical protein
MGLIFSGSIKSGRLSPAFEFQINNSARAPRGMGHAPVGFEIRPLRDLALGRAPV